MDAIQSWTSLPNLHPALVHFPVALAPVALLFDLVGLSLRRQRWLERAAAALWSLAALGAWVALWAGERAADGLAGVPARMQPYIARHSDWAHWSLYVVAALAVFRLVAAWREWRRERIGILPVRWALLLAGLAAVGLLLVTADLGGGLVYEHGAAVTSREEPDRADASRAGSDGPATLEAEHHATPQLTRREDGTLEWRPQPGDRSPLGTLLRPLAGTPEDAVSWREPEDGSSGGELQLRGRSLLLLPGEFGDVQVEAELDLSAFEGTVGVAHHVVGETGGGLFTLSTSGKAALVDLRDGHAETLGKEEVPLPSSPVTLAVSAAGRHLKGFLDGRTVVHGHAAQPARGGCGILLDGVGTVRILSLRVVPLR